MPPQFHGAEKPLGTSKKLRSCLNFAGVLQAIDFRLLYKIDAGEIRQKTL